MKLLITLFLAITFSLSAMLAQTIVGTDPENKNVVLEEFTGLNCPACPSGHEKAQQIYNANPDDVVVIAIHTGSYANPLGSQPDYRTEWGSTIAGQTGLGGYPSATVNRHVYYGGNTAMFTNYWVAASNQALAEPSYLNVGCEATIVTSTRQLIVEVEVYYTGDSPVPTNYLNVAILQNNIIGYQSGGSSNYNHMHMLRHLLTGQWGVEITETTTGSLYSKTITYELPENYNGVDLVLDNIDIVAFVSESHQEIISGNSAEITMITSNNYDAAIFSAIVPQTACSDELTPVVNLKNYGEINLTSLEFYYSVNNGDIVAFSWTGNLAQNESEYVTLPTLTYTPTDNNIINIWCELPNGETDQLPQNNIFSQNIIGSPNFPENCSFLLLVMENPESISWNISDENGTIVAEGGPYSNTGFKVHPFSFPETGCYNLTLSDATGQGLSDNLYVIADENDDIMWTGGEFRYTATANLAHGMIVDVDEILSDDDISIHPNPVTATANIEFTLVNNSYVNIAVFDILGKKITKLYNGEMNIGSQYLQWDVNELNNGVYFVKIQMNNQVVTKKILVTK